MPNLLRVRTVLSYFSGGPGLNTIYWIPGTPGGVTADATDAVARVRAMWLAMAPQFSSSMQFQTSNDVALIDEVTGTLTGSLAAAGVAGVAGTGGSNNEVVAAMLLVRLRTAGVRNGRLVKGRWYLGPVGAGVANGLGTVTTGNVTAMNTAANALLTGGATASVPCVWHRPKDLAPGAGFPVTSASTWDQFAVLRSRRD